MLHKLEIEHNGGELHVMRCSECQARWVEPTRAQIAVAQSENCGSFWQPEPEYVEVTTYDSGTIFIKRT